MALQLRKRQSFMLGCRFLSALLHDKSFPGLCNKQKETETSKKIHSRKLKQVLIFIRFLLYSLCAFLHWLLLGGGGGTESLSCTEVFVSGVWHLQETGLCKKPLCTNTKAPFWQAPKQLQMQQQHLHCKLSGARNTLKFTKF